MTNTWCVFPPILFLIEMKKFLFVLGRQHLVIFAEMFLKRPKPVLLYKPLIERIPQLFLTGLPPATCFSVGIMLLGDPIDLFRSKHL